MRAGPQRGFTLLEVLAAIVLLSLAFAALLGTLGRATRLAANADAHTRAALCAQSAMDSAFAFGRVQPGVTRGRCDKRFHWQLQTSPWRMPGQGPNPPVEIYRLDLTVSWGLGKRIHHARFSTLRAQMSPDAAGGSAP